jgi:hypothetical protein
MSHTIDIHPHATESESRLSWAGAGVIVAAPLVALLARLLLTPFYQDDADRPDHAKYLGDVAGSTMSNEIGATLTLLCAVLFGAAAVTVAALVRPTSPRIARVGEVLAAVGAFGLASYAMLVAVATQAARVGDREAMIALFDRTYDQPATNIFYIGLGIGSVGWLVLAYGLGKGKVTAKTGAAVAGIGTVAAFLTTPGPIVGFVAGGAALSLVGLLWVALSATKQH